jgi:hypothetical protein
MALYNGATVVDDPRTAEDLAYITRLVESGRDVIVTDPLLCFELHRNVALERFPGAIWLYFANDPDQCKRNVRDRADGRDVMGMIALASQHYTPPDDAFPVWRP